MVNRQPWRRSLFTISHLRSGLHSKQQILLGVLISLMEVTMNMVPAYRSQGIICALLQLPLLTKRHGTSMFWEGRMTLIRLGIFGRLAFPGRFGPIGNSAGHLTAVIVLSGFE